MTPKEALKPIKEIVRLFTKKTEIKNFDDEFNLIEQALNDLERLKKVEELLEVYRSKDMHMEDYYTYGSLRGSQKALDNLRSVREEIEVLEKELEEMKSEK